MSDNFLEAVKLLVKGGYGTEITIPSGQGFPAVKGAKPAIEKLQSMSIDPNGWNIRTSESRALTPENAPNLAVYGSITAKSNFWETAAMLAKVGFKAEVVIQPEEGHPAVEDKAVTEEIQSLSIGPGGIFIRTMTGRVLTEDNSPNIAHYSG